MLQYLKLSNQKRSRYISWNVLLFWGFGLWIALCTNNMYHSGIAMQEATLFYKQNWNSVTSYNTAIKSEIMETVLHSVPSNYTVCNTTLRLKTVLQYIYILLFVCSSILSACMCDYIKKKAKIWNNIMLDFHSIGFYLQDLVKNYKGHISENMIKNNNHDNIMEPNPIANYEINAVNLQFYFKQKVEKHILDDDTDIFNIDTNAVHNENRQLKSTCYLSWKYSMVQKSYHIKEEQKFSNRKRNNPFENGSRKRIISSSPEFQRFFANLKKSRFFYPCVVEISTSYVIQIKSTYRW